jgi:signal transduction histidine kinase/CheY-like chemotaxis protein
MAVMNFAKPKEHLHNRLLEEKWKILMVDDDEEVHSITKSVLKNIVFDNRGLELVSAYNGKDALEILQKEDDFALVLLDVVMETDDAGLIVAKEIRQKLQNSKIRIVLRTGEPGFAPEKEVILNYDINDYKEKTELTASKLFSTIISALRSYRDLEEIEKNKKGLRQILEASRGIFVTQSLEIFAQGVVTQMSEIFNLNRCALYTVCQDKYCMLYEKGNVDKELLSSKKMKEYFDNVVLHKSKCVVDNNICIDYINSNEGFSEIIYIEAHNELTDLDIGLIEVFISNIAIAHDNICLHEKIMKDKEAHIHDLDTKVKEKTKKIKHQLKELQNAQARLIQSEKLAGLGGMVAGVSHEINTPVGMALTGITHLMDETSILKTQYENNEMTEENFTDFIAHLMELHRSILINLERAANLVKSFKQVAVDQSSGENRAFRLKEYIQEVLISLQNRIKKTHHKIEVKIDEDLVIDSNPGAFSQIITNLILNSLIHAFVDDEKGIIEISANIVDNTLYLQYKDNGKGMEKETLEHIFEPFFTTNRLGGGSGLGMNLVYNIIKEKLQGEIIINSEVNKGTTVDIEVPLKG